VIIDGVWIELDLLTKLYTPLGTSRNYSATVDLHILQITTAPAGLPSGLFPSGFPTNILYACLISPIRTTCPAHLILLEAKGTNE
jgi:hypothetical protein